MIIKFKKQITAVKQTLSMRIIIIIIIIIIIKKGRQCKAERDLYTPYPSKDPSPTIPTYGQKEETGKRVEDYSRDRDRAA